MTLDEWLGAKSLSITEFAHRIGCTRVTIWRVINGRHRPSVALAEAISEATDGEVDAKSWPGGVWPPPWRDRNGHSGDRDGGAGGA